MPDQPPTHHPLELIPLSSLDAGDGSFLMLGVLDKERAPETNVSQDAPLVFWREWRDPGQGSTGVPDGEPRRLVRGRSLNPIYPLLIDGREQIVFAGEVDTCVDGVLLFCGKADQPPDAQGLALVGEPLGRRIWISHPQPWQPPMHVQVAWLHGMPEHITLDQ